MEIVLLFALFCVASIFWIGWRRKRRAFALAQDVRALQGVIQSGRTQDKHHDHELDSKLWGVAQRLCTVEAKAVLEDKTIGALVRQLPRAYCVVSKQQRFSMLRAVALRLWAKPKDSDRAHRKRRTNDRIARRERPNVAKTPRNILVPQYEDTDVLRFNVAYMSMPTNPWRFPVALATPPNNALPTATGNEKPLQACLQPFVNELVDSIT